jgi:outer membrane protein assembly factor BamB
MEIMDVLLWLKANHELATQGINPGIIPMVLIPLTAVTVAMTSIAGIVAGWFGVKLNTEGPKQFLEVLLKKRVLASMLLFNLAGIGAYKSYTYVKTMPSFLFTINRHSANAVASAETYTESLYRAHEYSGKIAPAQFSSLSIEKEIKLKKGAFRSGVISGNSIFYGVDDGYIYELDKQTLAEKRKFFVGTQVTTRPVIFKNRMFTGEGNHNTHHARIYSFDLVTGKFINSFSTKGHTEGQPLISQFKGKDYLFVTAGSDGLYAVDPMTMKEIWHQKDGHLDATVSVENGIVYIGNGVEKGSVRERSYAVAYDIPTGKKIWKTELPLSNWMHPVISDNSVCYVLGEIYFPSNIGFFHCLDKKTGESQYSMPFDAPLASKPFYIKDGLQEYVFFADFKGNICGVSLNRKEKMWCHKTGTEKTTYALSSFDYDSKRGILWYPSYDNGLFAVEPVSGKILTHWLPEKNKWIENYAAVNIDGNSLYHMDIEGFLRKFKVQ